MSVKRLRGIPGFDIDQVAAAAGDDPDILRLENLDTDLPPPAAALEATRQAIDSDEDNSYLPFTGQSGLRSAVAERINSASGSELTASNVVLTCGGTEGLFDSVLAMTDPGDEVVLTDPTYAGMIYRVRLAGAVAQLVPFEPIGQQWRLDLDLLKQAISPRTRVLFIMNPSMPSGAVLDQDEWHAIAEVCHRHDLWLLYNAAMERIVFDGHPVIHPASLPGMAGRTVTVGSVSKEFRMIGWRVGWVAAPRPLADDIARVHIYNVVTPTGIAQRGAAAALATDEDEFELCRLKWQRRRDTVDDQLSGYPMISAAGGWSQLIDVGALGYDAATASRLLLERGKIAATPMTHWGEKNSDQFVRFVFSNESRQRLGSLGERVSVALDK